MGLKMVGGRSGRVRGSHFRAERCASATGGDTTLKKLIALFTPCALAGLSAVLADGSARAARFDVQMRAPEHEISRSRADLGTIHEVTQMGGVGVGRVGSGMLAAGVGMKAMPKGLEADCVTVGAGVDAVDHFIMRHDEGSLTARWIALRGARDMPRCGENVRETLYFCSGLNERLCGWRHKNRWAQRYHGAEPSLRGEAG
jgi:hypothetical protein